MFKKDLKKWEAIAKERVLRDKFKQEALKFSGVDLGKLRRQIFDAIQEEINNPGENGTPNFPKMTRIVEQARQAEEVMLDVIRKALGMYREMSPSEQRNGKEVAVFLADLRRDLQNNPLHQNFPTTVSDWTKYILGQK